MLFALNETATRYRCAGVSGGKPVYTEEGEAFRCRTQPLAAQSNASTGQRSTGRVKLFAPAMEMHPGDRIVTGDGRALIAEEVKVRRALRGAHHLEIEARPEDAAWD